MVWSGAPLRGQRLVVVAPHPDDEVLCAGGLMRWTAQRGRSVCIIAVTDGEASHARSSRIAPDGLRRRRAGERAEALARLGVPQAAVVRLGMPDQGCRDRHDDMVEALTRHLRPGDVVVGPSRGDRHPDHVAVAEAVARAAPGVVGRWWEAPTWALVHGTAGQAGRTLALAGPAWEAKCHAMAAYRSQLEPLGPDAADGPVVHPHELAMMLRPTETFTSGCIR